MSAAIVGSIEVCYDCTALAVNGESPINPREGEPEPWALWVWQSVEMFPTPDFGHREEGVEYGMTDFSKTPCEGCGSTLAGTRYTFAVWGAE